MKSRSALRLLLDGDLDKAIETHSARRINKIVELRSGITRYLEIGVQEGLTLQGVKLPIRCAVDPFPQFNTTRLPSGISFHRQKSDDFFSELRANEAFDVIFLDGLHEWFQTYKDTVNALNFLSPGGVIIIDDVVPCDSVSAMPSLKDSYRTRAENGSPERRWHGDVYKVLFALRDWHPNVTFQVIVNGIDNPQAVVWIADSTASQVFNLVAKENDYDHLGFEEAFPQNEPPDFFLVDDEDSIIQRACRTKPKEA